MRKVVESRDQVNEVVDRIVRALGEIDRAITPRGSGNTLCPGGHDASGGYVTSLTEAVMGVTAGLCKIAESIDRYTNAVIEKEEEV